jgi:hypothetical protein
MDSIELIHYSYCTDKIELVHYSYCTDSIELFVIWSQRKKEQSGC